MRRNLSEFTSLLLQLFYCLLLHLFLGAHHNLHAMLVVPRMLRRPLQSSWHLQHRQKKLIGVQLPACKKALECASGQCIHDQHLTCRGPSSLSTE